MPLFKKKFKNTKFFKFGRAIVKDVVLKALPVTGTLISANDEHNIRKKSASKEVTSGESKKFGWEHAARIGFGVVLVLLIVKGSLSTESVTELLDVIPQLLEYMNI